LDVFFDDDAMILLLALGPWQYPPKGGIDRIRGEKLETLLDAESALSRRVVTRDGAWLVFGDQDSVYCSADRGATFERLEIPVKKNNVYKNHLLDAVVTEHGVFAVGGGGGDGSILFSSDGKSFIKLPVEGRLPELRSILPRGNGGLLIAGADGFIAAL
jgi:hypothetical protein